jgi:hypothetical protein
MILNSRSRRRWFGSLCLLASVGMLVVGETLLEERMSAVLSLLYWLVCLVFTLLAIGVALLDARVLRQEARDEHRALFESTLNKIERERADRN